MGFDDRLRRDAWHSPTGPTGPTGLDGLAKAWPDLDLPRPADPRQLTGCNPGSQASQQPGSAPAHAAARGSWGSRPCTPWALHLTGVISHWNDQSPALSLSPILSLNTLLARFLAIHSFTLTFDLASQPSPDLTALQSSLACPLLSCSRSRRTRRPTHFHVQTFLHSALLQASNMTWR